MHRCVTDREEENGCVFDGAILALGEDDAAAIDDAVRPL